jgi:hypothetical protein
MDVNMRLPFTASLYTGNVPTLYLYNDGDYWRYDAKISDVDRFLNWMNKILFPLVQLTSEEQVDLFFDHRKEWMENTPFFSKSPFKPYGPSYDQSNAKTRVVVFMYDKEDFSDEVALIRRSGRFSAQRDDLRIGIITDGKVIKRFKARYGSLYFPEGAHTSVVLMRHDK